MSEKPLNAVPDSNEWTEDFISRRSQKDYEEDFAETFAYIN